MVKWRKPRGRFWRRHGAERGETVVFKKHTKKVPFLILGEITLHYRIGLWHQLLPRGNFCPQATGSSPPFLRCSSSLSLWVPPVFTVILQSPAFLLFQISCGLILVSAHLFYANQSEWRAKIFFSFVFPFPSGTFSSYWYSIEARLSQIEVFLWFLFWSARINVWSVEPTKGRITSKTRLNK